MAGLPEVARARALMTEAMAWSVMKWLREKKRVRKVADDANAALDELDRVVKTRWSREAIAAYNDLLKRTDVALPDLTGQPANQPPPAITADARHFARQVKEADDEACRARMDAETTFDEAERRLSTSLAREGCRKAIHSWDLFEKAIRRAET
jgi:histone H3/H4